MDQNLEVGLSDAKVIHYLKLKIDIWTRKLTRAKKLSISDDRILVDKGEKVLLEGLHFVLRPNETGVVISAFISKGFLSSRIAVFVKIPLVYFTYVISVLTNNISEAWGRETSSSSGVSEQLTSFPKFKN